LAIIIIIKKIYIYIFPCSENYQLEKVLTSSEILTHSWAHNNAVWCSKR